MYTDIKIKLGIEKAEAIFNSTSGVKQGDNLAPALFLFAIQATIETMHRKWSSLNLIEPDLQYFPDKSQGFLNRKSAKPGTRLDHKDTFYANDAAFIFLSKEDLTKGTTFVQKPSPNSASRSTLAADQTMLNPKPKQCISHPIQI
jgi:hypothetical protein